MKNFPKKILEVIPNINLKNYENDIKTVPLLNFTIAVNNIVH